MAMATVHGVRRLGHELATKPPPRMYMCVCIYIHIYACVCVKSLQSCATLHDPMDCNLPGSFVYGILQTRTLEWVAIPFSRGSSRPRD